ncbi:P-type conjugative transfer ATPase TrbB [Caulobacter segnis]
MLQLPREALDRKNAALRQAMGPVLAEALAARDVVEVIVNADGQIWIDRIGSGRAPSGARLEPADAERVLRLVADHAGEVVTRDQPLIAGVLPETGERFQGVFMPVAGAPSFVIRKRPELIFELSDYVTDGNMTPQQAELLRVSAARRDNILVAGGTGSGKTTLANAILAEPAFSNDRVILVEDTPELQCSALDQLALLTRRADPPVTIADLVRAAMRLRPDRIVVGEVRDGAALDMLKAWNTGHPGGLATLHANSALEALSRLEDLAGEVAVTVPSRAIGQAIDVIVFMRRRPGGPVVEEILRVDGFADGAYRTSRLDGAALEAR